MKKGTHQQQPSFFVANFSSGELGGLTNNGTCVSDPYTFQKDHPMTDGKWLINMVMVPNYIRLWDPFQMAVSWLIHGGDPNYLPYLGFSGDFVFRGASAPLAKKTNKQLRDISLFHVFHPQKTHAVINVHVMFTFLNVVLRWKKIRQSSQQLLHPTKRSVHIKTKILL